MMYDRDKGLLLGLRFNDPQGKEILAAGKINENSYKGKVDFPV